ncbi:MAG: hypothetical protein F9K29_01900 [Hyphomicrobiaceae bacterium]|nr:MAG: hypothetical protein F9K29_01900 [Hyphomicrobiaceae bacterium]
MTAVKVTSPEADGGAGAGSRRERRLTDFHPAYRRYVRDLTCCSPALEDLADSFPAMLFALATGYGTPESRERAFGRVCDGAPLREAADALGLPWWLRKLPPQAFTAPLSPLPNDPDFAFRISSLVPRDTRLAPEWFNRVSHACEACGSEYALWLGRQPDLHSLADDHFAFMAAWSWFSSRPGLLGHRLLRRPWSAEMSLKRAREELSAWRERLRLIEWLGLGIESPWLADGTASGFDFVALRTVHDFIAESEALDNCLDQYADQLNSGVTAVFSIRKGARRVACVEIGLHEEEATMPTIVQLRGLRNRRVPPEIWQATFGWLGGQRLEPLSPERHAPAQVRRIQARRKLWGPYLAFLSGTRHEHPFRHVISKRSGVRRTVRRRAPTRLQAAPRLERTMVPARR